MVEAAHFFEKMKKQKQENEMQDNLIVRILTRMFDLLLLNILWILFCVPIFTIGASTTALYSVMLKLVENEEGYIMKDFVRGFKRNFRQSTIVWSILAVVGGMIVGDFFAIQKLQMETAVIANILLGTVSLLFLLELIFLFPLIARFENTTVNMFKNAILIPVSQLPYAVFVLLLTVLCIGATFLNTRTMLFGSVIWSLIGGALLAYANSLLVRKMFQPFEEKEEE